MTYQYSIQLILMCALSFTQIVHAQFGTPEEAVQAADEGKEPAYIEQAMAVLGQHLQTFVQTTHIASTKKKSHYG